jgi:TonB family protein
VTTLSNLAAVYLQRRDYGKAEPLLAQVVHIREKDAGNNHSELMKAVEAYSLTLTAQNKTAEVEALQKRINDLLVAQGVVLGGVLNGRALRLTQPEYPMAARMARASGQVRVQIVIDETGKVISAKTINPEPVHAALAAAAEDAARRSVFTPTFLSGKAVKVSGVIIYNFMAQ